MADPSNKSGVEASSSGRKRGRVGLVYDERMCKHSTPKGEPHPENHDHIRAIWNKLLSAGIPNRCVVFNGKEVEDKYIAAVHSNSHINLIKNISSKKPASKRNKVAAKYDSIYFNEGSSESANLAAGSVLEAAEKVAKGELDSVFAIVRPPGHHAEKSEPMGFCLYNNVAIATSFLLNEKELGINKILIVDWDVHHGNGTQKMFYKDPRVLVFSVHRHENGTFYPTGDDGSHIMMGEGPGAGYNINVPWENDQCADADYIAVWDHILIPVAREFKPDIIMISAGFDAAIGDPIGCCRVTPDGYSIMLKKLMEFSRGKTIMALEGGYNLNSLANSVLACVEVLLEEKPIAESFEVYPFESTWRVIKAVREQLSEYWPILAEKLSGKLTSRVTPQLQFDGPNTLSEDLEEDVTIPLSKLDFTEDARTQIKDLMEKLAQQQTTNANLASDILAKDKTIADKDKVIEELKQIAGVKTKYQEVDFRIKQLKKHRDEILHCRRMMITKGLPHIFSNLFDSAEFFIPFAKKTQLSYEIGCQEGLEEIKRKFFPSIALEDMEGYDGTVHDRYKQACNEFDEMEYPYLKEIAANADKPFEFIMNIKPKSIPLGNMEGFNSHVLDMCRKVCKNLALSSLISER